MSMSISTLMLEKRKSFAALSPGEARKAASVWLGDFTEHGPLVIRSIRVDEDGGDYVAVVTYRDAKVETSPRYFVAEPELLKTG